MATDERKSKIAWPLKQRPNNSVHVTIVIIYFNKHVIFRQYVVILCCRYGGDAIRNKR